MTREDYDTIQRMIDATIAHHLSAKDGMLQSEMIATMEDIDECASMSDIEDVKAELGSDIHDVRNSIDNLQSQIDDIDECL